MLQVRSWSQSSWSVLWLTVLTGCPKLSLDTPQLEGAPKPEQRPHDDEGDAGEEQGEPRAEEGEEGDAGLPAEDVPTCEGEGATMCCGDGSCDGPEDAQSCAADCAGAAGDGDMGAPADMMGMAPPACSAELTSMCCGDGVCGGPETHDNCAADCAEGQSGQDPNAQDPSGMQPTTPRACGGDIESMCCGDGVCDGPETHDNCAADCAEGQSGSMTGGGTGGAMGGSTGGGTSGGSMGGAGTGGSTGGGTGGAGAMGGGTGGGATMPTDPRPCGGDVQSMCCGDGTCDGPETAANCAADC